MSQANFAWRIPIAGDEQTGSGQANSTLALNQDWTLHIGYIRRWGGVLTLIAPAGVSDPWSDPQYDQIMLVAGQAGYDSRPTPDGGLLTITSVA